MERLLSNSELLQTPLYATHIASGAKMCSFAGHNMPIQYKSGVKDEHLWTRKSAGLFDVSHMGQIILKGADTVALLSHITPSNFANTPIGRAKYTVLTNEEGGIRDDLIITRLTHDSFFIVINAGVKNQDIAWIKQNMQGAVTMEQLDDRALIAIQGPKAAESLAKFIKHDFLDEQPYMTLVAAKLHDGTDIYVSRLGYTGEDGFEISIPNDKAITLWNDLCSLEEVKPVGLAARDSLRLEMGYPLYGHDINTKTSPIEADIAWIVSKGHDGFIGSERILAEKEKGVVTKRVSIEILDKGVAREGALVLNQDGMQIGALTSGGFSPTLEKSIGQAYVPAEYATIGTKLQIEVRGRKLAAQIAPLSLLKPQTISSKLNQKKEVA